MGGKSGGGGQQTRESYDDTTTMTLPEWYSQAGRDEYERLARERDQYAAPDINELLGGAHGLASDLGGYASGAFGAADELFRRDRGGGFASDAMERLFGYADRAGGEGRYGFNTGSNAVAPPERAQWDDFTSFDRSKYMDPYMDEVVGTTLDDYDRQAKIAELQRSSAATKAGAFGGARHGVQEGVAAGETARGRAATAAQLREQAYRAASEAIARDQTGRYGASAGNADRAMQGALAGAQLAAQGQSQNRASELAAIQSALQGGLGIGELDLARAGALSGFGQAGMNAMGGYGTDLQGMQREDALMPFDLQERLMGSLAGTRTNMTQTSRGTRTSTAPRQGGSALQRALGGAVSGLMSTGNPWGALAGAGMGLLGGGG